MNIGVVDSELNFNYRLFCKTVSNSATWGFDRLRLYYPKWHTRIQVRRPDGSILDTQQFATDNGFEHNFSFDLSENVNNDEYSVYICGVVEGNTYMQAYAYPTGYSATYGRNAQVTYWNLNIISPEYTAGVHGSLFLENQPLTTIDGALNIKAKTVRLQNSQLDAETLADIIIGLDNTGITGGSLNYSGNLAAPAERALTAYNNLKDNKGWALTGDVPNDAPQYDPDYQAVLDFATANTIPLPDENQKAVDNQRLIDYKATGGWAKDDVFFNFKSTADPAFRLIDWKRLIRATAYGSLTWSNNGVKGNGTNAYIDIKFIPSTDGVNYQLHNCSVGFTTFDQGTLNQFKTLLAIYSNGGGTTGAILLVPNGSTPYVNLQSGNYSTPNKYSIIGYNSVNKVDSNTINVISDVTQNPDTMGGGSLETSTPYLFARHRPDSNSAENFGDLGISFLTMGANKTTEHNAIKNVLDNERI